MKMAQATRTFWSQAEALEFITEKQKNDNSVNDRFCFNDWLCFLLVLGRNSLFIQLRITTGRKTSISSR
jgi:hypothetical protein